MYRRARKYAGTQTLGLLANAVRKRRVFGGGDPRADLFAVASSSVTARSHRHEETEGWWSGTSLWTSRPAFLHVIAWKRVRWDSPSRMVFTSGLRMFLTRKFAGGFSWTPVRSV